MNDLDQLFDFSEIPTSLFENLPVAKRPVPIHPTRDRSIPDQDWEKSAPLSVRALCSFASQMFSGPRRKAG